jgi:hypothetical protein
LNTDNDPVHALLSHWRDDPAGTYRTWFLWEVAVVGLPE